MSLAYVFREQSVQPPPEIFPARAYSKGTMIPRTERLSAAKRHPLSRVKQGAILAAKGVRQAFSQETLPAKKLIKTPYFSQWESSELVQDIVEGRRRAEDDLRWAESGAKTPAEYALWSWNCCGMACLKMILAERQGSIHPLVSLAKELESVGGYVRTGDWIDGLYYKPFCQYVQGHFKLEATSMPAFTLREALVALAAGQHVMLSVTPEIRTPEKIPHVRGGHLVLGIGYDLKKQLIYIHNPSGFPGESQEAVGISFGQFRRCFDYKGIVVG
jgi:hypothetical protein